MTRRIDYKAVSRIEFTDDDIEAFLPDTGPNGTTRQVASLDIRMLPDETASPATIEAFARLARTLKLSVTVNYSSLQINRDLTDEERREAALTTLRYGHTDLAAQVRDARAAEQGINPYAAGES